MTVEFLNNCSQFVRVTVEGKRITIPPKHCVSIEGITKSNFTFTVQCETRSRFYKGKCVLNIETVYNCESINDDSTFVITREKSRIGSNVYFERLLVSLNHEECNLESCDIPDEIMIKRLFNKRKLFRFFFVDPLEYLCGLAVVLVIVGVILSYVFGWKCAVVYFPVSYLLLLTINWCIEKMCNVIFKKGFRMDDDKTEFYSFFENDFITNYYSNPNREPYMGEIEIDK